MPDFQAIVDAVSNIGFPAALAIWALYMFIRKIDQAVTQSLENIEKMLQRNAEVNLEIAKSLEVLQELVLFLVKNNKQQ